MKIYQIAKASAAQQTSRPALVQTDCIPLPKLVTFNEMRIQILFEKVHPEGRSTSWERDPITDKSCRKDLTGSTPIT